jgi:hypothetical protein
MWVLGIFAGCVGIICLLYAVERVLFGKEPGDDAG